MAEVYEGDWPDDNRKTKWNTWLNGEKWICKAGEDYFGDMDSFRSDCHNMARRRELKVRTRKLDAKSIIIQAWTPDLIQDGSLGFRRERL